MVIEIIQLFLYSYIIFLIGKFILFLYKNIIRKRINFKQRYGENAWVLVTGATDGIGKAFCEEFAKEGFNIIFVSRNKEKLEKVSKSMEFNKVRTHIIEFDFTKRTTVEDYKETFGNLSKNFDIAILVNNVGMNDRGHFANIKIESFVDMINVNVKPQTMLTKILSDPMSNRKKRSAVIDLSSMSAIQPMPWRAMYAATKSYNKFLSRALAEEYKNYKIDFLCLKPLFVESPMTKKKASLIVITAEQCVSGTLNDLGYENETNGHWKHKVQSYGMSLVPEIWFYWNYGRK